MSSATNNLKLYSSTTANGYKVTILLELLGLKYDVQNVDLKKNEQKEEWFLKINPNGRIPTLVDSTADGDITISESAAIMQYLVDKYDTKHKLSYPVGTKEYYLQLETLYFQMAGLGPMASQAFHFLMFAPEKIPYAITRYTDETKRLYSVLEAYLARNSKNGSLYLVGDHYSISDIAIFPWVNVFSYLGIEITEYPLVAKWLETIAALPEVKKGLTVPAPYPSRG